MPSSDPLSVRLSCEEDGSDKREVDPLGLGTGDGAGDVSALVAGDPAGDRRGEGSGNSWSSSSSSIGEALAGYVGVGDSIFRSEGNGLSLSVELRSTTCSIDRRLLSTSSTVIERAV